MNSKLNGFILGFLIPVAIIIAAGTVNMWLSSAALIIYILTVFYILRPKIYTIIGTRKYGLGSTEDAIKWFGRAYATNKASIRSAVSYAYVLLKNKELQKAEDILQKIIKDNQNSQDMPYIKSIMSLVLWKKGELDQAADMLEEIIQTYKTTSVYGSLGYLLILKGDLEKALKFNLEAYEYNSSDNIINDNLGQNYYMLGMYDKACEIYEPLLAKAPSFPEPYYNYGLVLEKLGEKEKALEMMKKALNYKFSYLSSITKDEVESRIKQLEQ